MEKLINIQNSLKAPKGQFNAFGKYNYRSCEDILEAVKPLLYENKCLLLLTDEIIEKNNRFYVKSTASLYDGEKEYSVSGYAREEESKKGMDGSQVTGAASSYARKYALNGLFCIDDNKDADSKQPPSKDTEDLSDWVALVNGCSTNEELELAYKSNANTIGKDTKILKLFSNRKKELGNV
jgi:hypothetical protein